MLFDKTFFERRQKPLLVLLNLPIIGQLFRRALWINDAWRPITKITPTAYHVWLGRNKFRATLYSNAQYAEAMHRSFTWLWAMAHWWDMRVANRWSPALNLGFDTYSSQPDGTAGTDTTLQSTAATTNLGTNANLDIGESNAGADVFRALIKFDFSSLSSPMAVPSAATLSLWLHADFSSNAVDYNVHRQKRDWVETQATWNIWKTSNNWSTAGGFHANDCEQTAIVARAMTATESAAEKQWTTWDLTLLQNMWDGGWTNNGFLIKSASESNDWYRFRSSDYATAGERPKLVITYSLSSGGFFAFFGAG